MKKTSTLIALAGALALVACHQTVSADHAHGKQHSGVEKSAEGKCGEGKCGAHHHEHGKSAEGKCGEGKCGAGHK